MRGQSNDDDSNDPDGDDLRDNDSGNTNKTE
jgi:hypothetical protein